MDSAPAILQHIRQLRWVREVRSGFPAEHAAVWVLEQAGRQKAAGGTATDNNGVVTHAISFARWFAYWPLYQETPGYARLCACGARGDGARYAAGRLVRVLPLLGPGAPLEADRPRTPLSLLALWVVEREPTPKHRH
jgi:hypothetical protein